MRRRGVQCASFDTILQFDSVSFSDKRLRKRELGGPDMFKRMLMFTVAAIAASPIAAQSTPQPAAQGIPPGPPPTTLGAAQRKEVVAALATALRQKYVFPDVGEKAASRIDAALAAGEYDSLADPTAFAARLAADVGAIAHDKHLRVNSMAGPPPSPPPGALALPHAEAGVVRADKLAGNIGYVEVIGFPPRAAFKPVIDQAISSLAGSKALIIDDRRNGGGSPEGDAYLLSFLLPPGKPVRINDIVARVPGKDDYTRQSFFSEPTPVSFAGRPVYVLTSNYTFSGGEAFAYDVKSFGRGVLVGELTGGGANPTGPVFLGNGLVASIPTARAENAITKTNWEGHGVDPDIAVPAADALKVALEKLGQEPVSDIALASRQQVFTPRAAPLPGTEEALRSLVAGVVSGNPDYARMSPEFADTTRRQLPQLHAMLGSLGELKSIKFVHPAMMVRGDAFDLTFANGVQGMAVVLGPDGKLAGIMMRPPGS